MFEIFIYEMAAILSRGKSVKSSLRLLQSWISFLFRHEYANNDKVWNGVM